MSWEARMVARAAAFAAKAHGSQIRKDAGDPYFIHVAEVADALAACEPFNVFLVSAAFLHDTVEDTNVTLNDILVHFGPETASIVAEVTDAPDIDSKRKQAIQAEHMKTASEPALLLKIADKTSNVAELVNLPKARRPKRKAMRDYLKGARLVVDQCRGLNSALEQRFDEVAARLEALSASKGNETSGKEAMS